MVCLHPGWVQTDMGGPNALISTENCIKDTIDTLQQLSDEHTGLFLRSTGQVLPW